MKPFFALFFLLIGTTNAQLISFGVKAGIPLNDSAIGHDESKRFIVGPTVEFGLPIGFALEIDALYQRLGNGNFFLPTASGTVVPGSAPIANFVFHTRQRGNSWQFPLLGKYYFRRSSFFQPFVSTGFSFRTIGLDVQDINLTTFANGATQAANLQSNYRSALGVGAVAAAGFRFKAGPISIAPEFRYTRWGSDDRFATKNAATVFVGFRF